MVNIRYSSLTCLACISFLSTACTTGVVQTPGVGAPVEQGGIPDQSRGGEADDIVFPDISAPVDDQKAPAREPVQHKTRQAVIALLIDADHYVDEGQYKQAEASLERALRIDPKNPLLWHKLGRLHLQQGEWDAAITMANKSNVLAKGNTNLQADNWLMIAHARKALGDRKGASEAMVKVEQLRRQ